MCTLIWFTKDGKVRWPIGPPLWSRLSYLSIMYRHVWLPEDEPSFLLWSSDFYWMDIFGSNWNIWPHIELIVVKCSMDIHVSQKLNSWIWLTPEVRLPNHFNLLNSVYYLFSIPFITTTFVFNTLFSLASDMADSQSVGPPLWSTLKPQTTIGWITLTLLQMFICLVTYPLVSPGGLNNHWINCHEKWCTYSWSPQDVL